MNTIANIYSPEISAAILGFLMKKDRFIFMDMVAIEKQTLERIQWKTSTDQMNSVLNNA